MAGTWCEVKVSPDSSAPVIRVDAAGLSDSSTFLLTLHDVISQKTSGYDCCDIQGDTKKRELLKNPTKIEEIQKKNLLTEIEPL